MNKKIVLICLIIMTLILSFCALLKLNYKNFKYDNLIVSEAEWNQLIEGKEAVDFDLISKLKFNDYEILYDVKDNIYYYSLIEGDDNSYNPIISFFPNTSNVNVAILDKKISKELMENNETIQLLIYNDNSYKLTNLKCTTLPIMNIEVSGDILYQQDKFMKMTLFDNREHINSRLIQSDGFIHGRGATSSVYPKQGFKVSLTTESLGNHTRKNHQSLLGMRYDDDWVLYAAYNDQEKIRNVFSTNLWYQSCADNNVFGVKNGNEYKYIELFLNNEYWGLYALGFPIDEKTLNVKEPNEYMFKKTQMLDYIWQGQDDIYGYKFLNYTKEDGNGWDTLKQYYQTLQNSKNIDELYNTSDINNIIDFYLFISFVQGMDHGEGMVLKNTYMTFKNYNDRKIVIYTPWDLDVTFGRYFERVVTSKDNIINQLNAVYFIQNLGDTKINEMIKDRYATLRNDKWSNEYIDNMLSELEEDIYDSGAFKRDADRWPDGIYYYEGKKLSDFKVYVSERLESMDEFINNL